MIKQVEDKRIPLGSVALNLDLSTLPQLAGHGLGVEMGDRVEWIDESLVIVFRGLDIKFYLLGEK